MVSSNKTSASAYVDKYTFNLFSKETFGDPAYPSTEFETILFTIVRTETSPGVYTYSSNIYTKVWNAERTQMRRDSYDVSETSPSSKYYSITGTLNAINKLSIFKAYRSESIASTDTYVVIHWHGTGQSGDKPPAAVIRVLKGTVLALGATEVKDYEVTYVFDGLEWEMEVQFPSALGTTGLLEVWSDIQFYR